MNSVRRGNTTAIGEMLKADNDTLNIVIQRNFLTSSLIPIFTIEAILLLLYFGISSYLSSHNQEILETEARFTLEQTAQDKTQEINLQLREVSDYARLLQADHQRFFDDPSYVPLPKNPPRFETASNGIYYKASPETGGSIYYSARTKIDDQERDKALRSEAMDPLLSFVVENDPNVVAAYLNTFDSMNRYVPFIKDVPKQYSPEMNIPDFNFYYLADATHNPKRDVVWTSVYLDPAGQGWMASCIVPIYRKDFLEGVTGLDVTIEKFVNNILSFNLRFGASAFLVDETGTVMAMSEKVEQALGLKELKQHTYEGNVTEDTEKPAEFNLLKSNDSVTAKQFQRIFNENITIDEFKKDDKHYLLAQATIQETGWHLFLMVDKEALFAPIEKLKTQSRRIGYAAVGIMLLFYVVFFFYLARKAQGLSDRLAPPIESLSHLTTTFLTDNSFHKPKLVGIREVDTLSENFHEMVIELRARTDLLQQTNLRLEEELGIRKATEKELARHRDNLEEMVQQRTEELHQVNTSLQSEIEERLQAEREIRKFKTVADEALYGVALVSSSGELRYANPTLSKVLNRSLDELINKNVQELFPDDCDPSPIEVWESLQTNQRLPGLELSVPKAGPFPQVLFINAAAVLGDKDQVEFYGMMVLDITESKRLEMELRRSQKLESVGQLAAGIAHEINTPIQYIGDSVHFLKESCEDTCNLLDLYKTFIKEACEGRSREEIEQDILKAEDEADYEYSIANVPTTFQRAFDGLDRVARIVAAMKEFAHPDSQEKTLMDINHALGNTITVASGEIKNVATIETDFQSIPQILAYPGDLNQVFINLIVNAADAIREKQEKRSDSFQGHIVLSTKMENDGVMISISDNGEGISPDIIDKIYDQFFTTKDVGKGTGQGLSISWAIIVDKHQGTITVESRVGEGTSFSVWLPIPEEEELERMIL